MKGSYDAEEDYERIGRQVISHCFRLTMTKGSQVGSPAQSSYVKYLSARQIGGLNSSDQPQQFVFGSIGPALFD